MLAKVAPSAIPAQATRPEAIMTEEVPSALRLKSS